MKALSFYTAILCCGVFVSSTLQAQTVLIDLGNDDSFRGASVPAGPDSNGNHWTSVWNGAFYSNIPDITGVATTIDFGFDGSLIGGTDSFNGPAGATFSPIDPNQIAQTDIDAGALGNLGGALEAAFDFYTSSRFQIQGLNASNTYDLTFYSAHKFSAVDETVFNVYSDPSFSSLVASTTLRHQDPNDDGSVFLHNRDTVASINGLSPGVSNILYVEFLGSDPNENGYLNALQIQGNSIPTTTRISDFSSTEWTPFTPYGNWDGSSFTQNPNSLTVSDTGFGGAPSPIATNLDATGNTHVELDVTVNSADEPNLQVILADGDGTEYVYRWFSVDAGDHTLSFRIDTLTNPDPNGPINGIDQANSYPGNPGTTPGLDLSTLSFYHIQVDPADPNSAFPYSVEFDNLRVKNVPGSFNTDELVDARDFLVFQRGEGAFLQNSGSVAEWETNYGNVGEATSINVSAVPEPTAATLVLLATGTLLGYRRRRDVS